MASIWTNLKSVETERLHVTIKFTRTPIIRICKQLRERFLDLFYQRAFCVSRNSYVFVFVCVLSSWTPRKQ